MGALYVEDAEAMAMATELAEQRGLSEVAAIKVALANELARGQAKPSVHEIVAELRRTSPLTFDPDVVIDKAFYDSLNDEEDD